MQLSADKGAGHFRDEFFATLKILQSGDVREDDLKGSWAGAFGQTQFMPTTFLRLAVDFDKDGRRDLVDSQADALASTANYLAKGGWRHGEPWGFEVALPPRFEGPGMSSEGLPSKSSRASVIVRVASFVAPVASWQCAMRTMAVATRGLLANDETTLLYSLRLKVG